MSEQPTNQSEQRRLISINDFHVAAGSSDDFQIDISIGNLSFDLPHDSSPGSDPGAEALFEFFYSLASGSTGAGFKSRDTSKGKMKAMFKDAFESRCGISNAESKTIDFLIRNNLISPPEFDIIEDTKAISYEIVERVATDFFGLGDVEEGAGS